jgi:hypothetical protein
MDIKSILSCFCSSENEKNLINLMFRGFNFERFFVKSSADSKELGFVREISLKIFEMKSDGGNCVLWDLP